MVNDPYGAPSPWRTQTAKTAVYLSMALLIALFVISSDRGASKYPAISEDSTVDHSL